VPFYGDAVFQTRAGEQSRFKLKPKASRLESGKASLKLKPPAWRHNIETLDLGYVPVEKGLNPVQLNSRYTERLMAELMAGYELELVRAPWYGAEESTSVMISPIGFRDAYQRYLDCLADLLPVNFDQVKRTAVYFGSNKYEPLPNSQLLKLNNLLSYIKTDASIKAFYVDGHTDSVGTRADNYILAENRAKEVTAYLVAQGVSEDKVTVRWHGERYPVANNATVAGRSQNRRVTIRIERDPALIPKGAESSEPSFNAATSMR
jgi:outer membrane protein OmpA-like peptidoglycan-associated protein